jgi:hypothetical protein
MKKIVVVMAIGAGCLLLLSQSSTAAIKREYKVFGNMYQQLIRQIRRQLP